MTCTFLDIAKSVSVEVGIAIPDTAQDQSPNSVKLGRLINETCFELVRRVDWHVLSRRQVITGDGSSHPYPFESDYGRLSPGLSVKVGLAIVRGGVTQDEWMSIEPTLGTPRYFFATSSSIEFYPYPADGDPVTVNYQSAEWCQSSEGSGRRKLTADTDICLLPAPLVVRGSVWRWLRQDGRDFSDHNAEFEAMLKDFAASEGAMRSP